MVQADKKGTVAEVIVSNVEQFVPAVLHLKSFVT